MTYGKFVTCTSLFFERITVTKIILATYKTDSSGFTDGTGL